jgi:uncharacterized protein YeaO (DUF488 family)
MPLKTKRWNDPREADDGWRLLVCRYRPRALPKKDETWDRWYKALSPSKELHADIYGKHGPPLAWEDFRRRYFEEMQSDEARGLIDELAALVAEGKTITLLCSSACTDESRCHRALLRGLIEERLAARAGERTAK